MEYDFRTISYKSCSFEKNHKRRENIKNKLLGKSESSNTGIIQDKTSIKNKVINWVRGNIFVPDPKVFWVKPSIKLLAKKIKKEGITHIVSTGPPHSMHLIALGLKNKNTNLKWVADFRDPWSELDLLKEFHLTKKSKQKYRDLEKEVLVSADVTLTVSESWVESFKYLGSRDVRLITNGFDEDDFDVKKIENDKFIIGHFGLLNHLRNPKKLWKTLNDLCDENPDFNEKLEIRLSGNIDTEVLQDITQYFYLKNKIKVLGYLSHKDVLKQYNSSSVLLLLLFNSESGKGNYPGKIFEYFAAKRSILAFGPEDSDTEKLIQKTKTGVFFTYDEIELKKEILNLFHNDSKTILSTDFKDFSRKKLTKDLSNVLNSI